MAEFRRAEPLASSKRARAAIVYNIGRCLEELKRDEAAVEAFERYLEAPDDRSTARTARRKVRALTKRVFGELRVTCEGPGQVSLGPEHPVQACPARWSRLRAGSYVASVSGGGFITRHEVAVAAGGSTVVDTPVPGALAVNSRVVGEAWLGDQVLGETPIPLLVLAPGRYQVEVRAPEHARWHQEVTVQAAELTTVEAAPLPLFHFPDSFEPYLRWSVSALSLAALAGGTATLLYAEERAEELDQLVTRYQGSMVSDEVGRLRAAATDAEDDARGYRAAGYSLLGAGVLLGGAATWLFLREAEPGFALRGGSVQARF